MYAAQARHRHNELHEHGANALSVAHWRANAMLDGPRGCGKRRPRKPQNRIVLLLRASDAHEAAEGRGGAMAEASPPGMATAEMREQGKVAAGAASEVGGGGG